MSTIDWTPVEQALKTDSIDSLKLAILESYKIVANRLRQERVPGQTTQQQLQVLELSLTRPKDALSAATYAEALLAGDTPALTKDRAKRHIQALRQVVADIADFAHDRNLLKSRFRLAVGRVKTSQRRALKVALMLGAFCLLVVFLADTASGQSIVSAIVDTVHAIFRLVLLLAVIVLIGAAAVIGTAVLFGRSRGGKIVDEEQ
jgi:uncharacterized membrane protein YqjE